jgi:hypothetical protein
MVSLAEAIVRVVMQELDERCLFVDQDPQLDAGELEDLRQTLRMLIERLLQKARWGVEDTV